MALMFLSRRRNRKMNVNLNHISPTTLAPGNLAPISFVRIIAGDDVSVQLSAFMQAMPMVAPLVNGFKLKFEYFFIPDRLYNWDTLVDNSGVTSNPDSVEYPVITSPAPLTDSTGNFTLDLSGENYDFTTGKELAAVVVSPGSLADYCGFAVGTIPTWRDQSRMQFSALKMLGYLDTYYHYYVNQQVYSFPSASFRQYVQGAGGDAASEQNVTYKVDSLRSLLDTVKRSPTPRSAIQYFLDNTAAEDLGSPNLGSWQWFTSRASIFQRCMPPYYLESWLNSATYNDSEVLVDLSDGDTVSFRNIAAQSHVQRWLDLAMAGGSRYSDYINAEFDVSRLKNTSTPIFLGADSQLIGSNTIYQTSGAGNAESPLGSFAGQTAGGDQFRRRTYHFGEPGFFMVMASLVPDTIYSRGLDPTLRQLTMGDMYAPALDNIAMQPLMVEQLDSIPRLVSLNPSSSGTPEAGLFEFQFATDDDIKNTAVGFVPAWSELMQVVSRPHDLLTTVLSYWLLNRRYGTSVEDVNNSSLVGTTAVKDFASYLQQRQNDGTLSAEDVEALTAFFYRLELNSDYSPYIYPNRYNDVFADQSNQARNFVVNVSLSMRANREKGKVNTSTTI